MANSVLQRKDRQSLLLRCFKTLYGCIGKVCKASLGIYQPHMHHSMSECAECIGSLSGQCLSQIQPSWPLSTWQMVCCNVRRDSHCFWSVSKHFVGALARFARLPWAYTNLLYITLCPNGWNVLAHSLATARTIARASQVDPSPHDKWCVAT